MFIQIRKHNLPNDDFTTLHIVLPGNNENQLQTLLGSITSKNNKNKDVQLSILKRQSRFNECLLNNLHSKSHLIINR
eukprot:UN20614